MIPNDSSLPSITDKTSPVQRNPRSSTRDSVKSTSFSDEGRNNTFFSLLSTVKSNRSISPAPRGVELPELSVSLRASTRNSIKSSRGSRSSFIHDHSDRDYTDGKTGRSTQSYSNLSDSIHSSVDGDNNGKNVRVSRSSFNLSDSNHGSNISMKSSTRSSFDRDNDGSRSGRISRASFNSDTDSIKSSHTVTSENNPSPSPSQRRAGRSLLRDSIKSLSSFKESDSAKRQRDSVARSLLDEYENDFLLSMGDN